MIVPKEAFEKGESSVQRATFGNVCGRREAKSFFFTLLVLVTFCLWRGLEAGRKRMKNLTVIVPGTAFVFLLDLDQSWIIAINKG